MHKPNKNTISDLEQSKLDVLLKDYELTNTKIEKFVGNQFLFTQGALVLTGGYVFFLIEGVSAIDKAINTKTDTKFYLQFLPFFVLLILSGVLYQYQRTVGLQGYKQYLEQAINKLVGQNLISYGHIGMRLMLKNNLVSLLNAILYASVYAGACFLAVVKPSGTDKPQWLLFHIIGFVLFLTFAIWQTTGHSKRVKDIAQKASQFEDSLEEFDDY
ncbi:hypothetical protein [Olleya sp. YS]|uniref:hypothetical protein n=1 Tax=Olleya sp. YS TaxID=3028318 RepID=UPI002434153B|nr:hypothetical protein [Olleya sp. YS]WGD34749.1 hypothetical protein Ollyesu_13280 [Olleya sp. YS]